MKITSDQALETATELIAGVGVKLDRARATARALVLAELWGLGSHGLLRLPIYLDRSLAGGNPADADLVPVTDTGSLVVLDGGGGLGHWQLSEASAMAVERASRHGVAVVAVGDSGHCGALGVYAADVAEAGMAALVTSTGPAVLPPWGGDRRLLSTSPLAAGFPLTPRPAVVDLALSTVARGKIAAYAARDEPLPDGWALDADGNPTNDPQEALGGMLSPLGGAKGYALAFMVEALTAGLVGPSPAEEVADFFDADANARRQGIAHLLVVIDPRRTDHRAHADGPAGRLGRLAESVHSAGGRVPGARRLAPSELSGTEEFTVDDALWSSLLDRVH